MAFGKRRARGRSVGRKRTPFRKPFRKMGGRKRARSAPPKRMIGRSRTVTNSKEIPQFSSTKMTNVVSHREYIGDLYTGGTAPPPFEAVPSNYSSPFTIGNVQIAGSGEVLGTKGFKINVGVKDTFPWLYNLARNYEQYRVHGMVFEFKSLSADALSSTNTALGSVIMATEYNAANPVFISKQQMENYEFAQSCKPSVSMMHAIECAPNLTSVSELYVRVGDVPVYQDPRLYDLGTFQIATCGMQAPQINIGELWCTYLIELIKPKLPNLLGCALPILSGLLVNSRTIGPQVCTPMTAIVPNRINMDPPTDGTDPFIVGNNIVYAQLDTSMSFGLLAPVLPYGSAKCAPGYTYRISFSVQLGQMIPLNLSVNIAVALYIGDGISGSYAQKALTSMILDYIDTARPNQLVTGDYVLTIPCDSAPQFVFLGTYQLSGSSDLQSYQVGQVAFEVWQLG